MFLERIAANNGVAMIILSVENTGFNVDLRADAFRQVSMCECMSMELHYIFKPHQLSVHPSVVPSIQHLPIYAIVIASNVHLSPSIYLTTDPSSHTLDRFKTFEDKFEQGLAGCPKHLAKSMAAGILAIKTRQNKKKKKLLATKPKTLETWHKPARA
uniref:Uncharacterized protein n=1 Tax=Glossina pallidipes TaxID=7398 RepID=A0A1A9Z6E4_GLOPL